MTELTEGDKMALLSEWVPLDAAYVAWLLEQHERERRFAGLVKEIREGHKREEDEFRDYFIVLGEILKEELQK